MKLHQTIEEIEKCLQIRRNVGLLSESDIASLEKAREALQEVAGAA